MHKTNDPIVNLEISTGASTPLVERYEVKPTQTVCCDNFIPNVGLIAYIYGCVMLACMRHPALRYYPEFVRTNLLSVGLKTPVHC